MKKSDTKFSLGLAFALVAATSGLANLDERVRVEIPCDASRSITLGVDEVAATGYGFNDSTAAGQAMAQLAPNFFECEGCEGIEIGCNLGRVGLEDSGGVIINLGPDASGNYDSSMWTFQSAPAPYLPRMATLALPAGTVLTTSCSKCRTE